MLNQEMDSVLLVKGWKKGANWSFPRGKINKGESDLDCAIREVYEETGFDIKNAGLASNETEEQKSIEISMREQHMRLYVFRGVPMDFEFAPRTRKEISKIQWYKLSELPTLKKIKAQQDPQTDDLARNANKYYMVAPFLGHLKKWIGQQKKAEKDHRISTALANEVPTKMAVNSIDNESAVPAEAPMSGVGDMERLLASLRQSEQASKGSQGNPLSKDVASMKALAKPEQAPSSTDISNEVFSKASPFPEPQSESSERHIQQEAKSSDLLALLRGTPTSAGELPPETPADQLLHNPLAPPSAKLEHKQAHHPHMPPTNPRPHAFPVFPSQDGQIAPPQRPGAHTAPSLPHVHQVHHAQNNVPQPRQGLATQRPREADYLSYIQRPRPEPPAAVLRNPQRDPSQQEHTESLSGLGRYSTGPPTTRKPLATPLSTKAPYQRTGDPDFARPSQDKAEARRIIPPASNLPTPKLNNHTSSLLSLFKSPPPTQELSSAPSVTPIRDRRIEAPTTKGSTSCLSSFDERVHSKPNTLQERQLGDRSEVERIRSKTNQSTLQTQYPNTNAIPQGSVPIHYSSSSNSVNPELGAVPSQLEHIILASQKKTHQEASDSKHQNALLDLFRKPSAGETQPRTPPREAVPRSLELPSNSFELSATPRTPGYTQGPSRVSPPLKSEQANAIGTSPLHKTKAHNHHSQKLHKPHKPSKGSSAAVNEPLTIPQFELMHHAKEAQDGSSRTDGHKKQPLQQGSIKILQRPSSKGVDGAFTDPFAKLPAKDPDATPKPLADPTKSATPKPHVNPSNPKTPQASFQPQILRRPAPHAADGDLVAPSPLSPLPSPKHPVLLTRHGNEKSTHQHKQSLLAMFSQPSATSNEDNAHTSGSPRPMASMDLNPLTSKQRHGSGLTDTMHSQCTASATSGSTQGAQTSGVMESHAMIVSGSSSGASTQATPRGSVTAMDKSFLLGYLGDVARSAR